MSAFGRLVGYPNNTPIFFLRYGIMTVAPSICFVIPYFGKWPFWMPLFLESCRSNPDIDWLLFSDSDDLGSVPANVRIERIDYASYCSLVSTRLGINFAPENPYKLCDLKPSLGYIHQDELIGYDFWAFGDLDLIYGRLRGYFTAERLAHFDLFSTHARRVSGHMCLLRNTEKMRNLFMRIPRWQERLSDQDHHALDEGAFTRLFLWRKNFPKPLFNLVGWLNPLRRRSEFIEAFSTPDGCIPWSDGSFSFPKRWFWQAGSLTNELDGCRQFLYFHFAIWKRGAWSHLPTPEPEMMEVLAKKRAWVVDQQGFSEWGNHEA
jgi:hypothetical protein